jgi:hypothetical protein
MLNVSSRLEREEESKRYHDILAGMCLGTMQGRVKKRAQQEVGRYNYGQGVRAGERYCRRKLRKCVDGRWNLPNREEGNGKEARKIWA